MNEQYQFLFNRLTQDEQFFLADNEAAIRRLITKMVDIESGVITLDLQRKLIVAANTTTREHFVG